MERLVTIYIHSADADDKEIAKRLINKAVLKHTHSLVAWYPDLGEDGLQGVFVTDCSQEDIAASFGERWMAILGIEWECKIQHLKKIENAFKSVDLYPEPNRR